MNELKPFEAAQPELDRWRYRGTLNPPEEPEPGSDLADDDKAFPYHRVSETVRICLVSAGEHLRLVWDGLARGNLYSTAQYAALRGALVAAAQAVWMSAPNDPATRQNRGHAVIAESYEQLRRYHQRTLDLALDLKLSSDDRQKVADQIEWVKSRQTSLTAVRTSSLQVNMADVLRDVGPDIFPTDPQRRAGLRLAWNVLSSDAHTTMWGVASRASLSASEKHSTLSILATGTHIGDLAAWHDLVLCSLRRGWGLFDQRCEEGPSGRR
ncbi:hypothetical protein [Nocardia beijingensis]|uniref:Uncharacterized protein n=1 Tax=Nocardia beijingensis TaxID=95162 RepID=A0ABW7W790_9NOCA